MPPIKQMVNVAQQDPVSYLFNGNIHPQNELTQRMHIISDRVG
jgi:predicted adenine nucleotide alpha hydrolase (AANH) superfamily ATPase